MGLQIVAISFSNDQNVRLSKEFSNARFAVWADKDTFHLNISEANNEDIGIYYCGKTLYNQAQFVNGTILTLTGEKSTHI